MHLHTTTGGDIVLEGEVVNLKIATDRRVYRQWVGKDKTYAYIGRKIDRGLSRDEKEEFLLKLRQKILERLEERGYPAEGEEGDD